MLTERQMKNLERIMDERIVNEDVIKNPDREITDVVFKALSKYKFAYLAAYSYEMADLSTIFEADFKAYLYKLSESKKNKTINDVTTTVDISNITDAFMMIRMKYIVKPEFISDKYKFTAYQNTINEFDENTFGYQVINKEVLEELQRRFDEERNDPKNPLKEPTGVDKEYSSNLFCEEQVMIIPIIDKSHKYRLNGISYYGAHNNIDSDRMTTGGEYSIKTFRDSNHGMVSILIGHNDEMGLYVRYYGSYVNAYIFLSKGDVTDKRPEDIIPFTGNEEIDKLLAYTWKNALKLYEAYKQDENTVIYEEYRLKYGEEEFKEKMIHGINKYLGYSFGLLVEDRGVRYFEQISTLEEEMYSLLNGGNSRRRSTPRKQEPSIATKRINIRPLSVLTLIKTGNSGQTSPNRVFVSTTTEPNPLDIFNMFLFIKKTHHNASGNAVISRSNTNQREEEQLIVMEDMKYLGQFAPKSNKHLGSTTQLHFNIDSKRIKRRGDLE